MRRSEMCGLAHQGVWLSETGNQPAAFGPTSSLYVLFPISVCRLGYLIAFSMHLYWMGPNGMSYYTTP